MKHSSEFEQLLKFVAKSSLIVFFGALTSKILLYIYRITIARQFGPEVYGLFSLALIAITWFTAIFSLGLIGGITRFIPLYRGKKRFDKITSLINWSKKILVISSIMGALLLYFASEFIAIKIFHDLRLVIFIKVFSIGLPLAIFADFFLALLKSFEKVAWYSFIVNILQNTVKVAALIFLILLGFKINAIVFSYFLGIMSMMVVAYIVFRHKIGSTLPKSELQSSQRKEMHRSLLIYSWPIILSSIISSIFIWTDSFMLGYLKGVENVGLYNAATPIVALLGIVPDLFAQFFLPLITKEFSRKKHESIKELSKQVEKWNFLLNLPLFLLMFLFPGVMINLLFGQEYLVAENALRILSIGGLIASCFVALSGDLLSMIGKTRHLFINLFLVSVINLILNGILIPLKKIGFLDNSTGIIGAALATSLAWGILGILLLVQVRYHLRFTLFRRKMGRILVISLIPAGMLMILKQFTDGQVMIMLAGIFFILLYFFLILLTGCLDKYDIMILNSLKKKLFKSKEEDTFKKDATTQEHEPKNNAKEQ